MVNIENLGECLEEKLLEQVRETRPLIEDFCKKYENKLIRITTTMEKGISEPAYIFDDGLGYYTIEGIKASL